MGLDLIKIPTVMKAYLKKSWKLGQSCQKQETTASIPVSIINQPLDKCHA